MTRSADDAFDERVGRIAALGEPIRRALYRYVVAQREPVARDQAATAIGVPHHVAKFHLDKLEADGLLDVEYSRPPGRRGPGAGRPAKRYRRSTREVAVSLPERRYDIVGAVMADALTRAAQPGATVRQAVQDAAAASGRALGDGVRQRLGRRSGRAARLGAVCDVLTECGYEPRTDDGQVVLGNCPFHGLAEQYTDLVCGTNLDLLAGLLAASGETGLYARLDPGPDRCCVVLGPQD